MGKGKRVALYVRVSTDGQTTVNQERELRDVAERHGWNVVDVFRDHAISGRNGREKRPGLDRPLRAVAKKEVDVVAAWSVDRRGAGAEGAGADPRRNGDDWRRRPIVSRRRVAAQSAWPRVPGAPRVRAGPSHRHARRAAGDRGPWVAIGARSRPVGQPTSCRCCRAIAIMTPIRI